MLSAKPVELFVWDVVVDADAFLQTAPDLSLSEDDLGMYISWHDDGGLFTLSEYIAYYHPELAARLEIKEYRGNVRVPKPSEMSVGQMRPVALAYLASLDQKVAVQRMAYFYSRDQMIQEIDNMTDTGFWGVLVIDRFTRMLERLVESGKVVSVHRGSPLVLRV